MLAFLFPWLLPTYIQVVELYAGFQGVEPSIALELPKTIANFIKSIVHLTQSIFLLFICMSLVFCGARGYGPGGSARANVNLSDCWLLVNQSYLPAIFKQ